MSRIVVGDAILYSGDMFTDCFPHFGDGTIDAIITDFLRVLNKRNGWDKLLTTKKILGTGTQGRQ